MLEDTRILIAAVTVGAGVFGVVLGAILKPMVEDWFNERRKTIRISYDELNVIKTPHQSVSMEWNGHKFFSLKNMSFDIKNITGRTQRDFTIDFHVIAKPTANDFSYIAMEKSDGVRFEFAVQEGTDFQLKMEHLPVGASLTGAMISSYADNFTASTKDDFELKMTNRSKAAQRVQFFTGLGAAAGLGGLASALAASLAAILGN